MDTKLKKINKWKVLIIALVVLLPSLILVGLYPGMEKAMLERQAQEKTEASDQEPVWDMTYNFVNYAVEASYYMYGLTMQELNKSEIDFSVLDENGWINDYYEVHEGTEYYAVYTGNSKDIVTKNTDEDLSILFENTAEKDDYVRKMFNNRYLAYLLLEFNSYGQITDIRYQGRDDVILDSGNLYERAKDSVRQYEHNAAFSEEDVLAEQVCPKSFKAVFAIPEGSNFVNNIVYYYQQDAFNEAMDEYINMGVFWIIIGMAVIVAAIALVLPFLKKLQTGWEKLFSISLEALVVIGTAGLCGAVGMCYLMFFTTMSGMEELAGIAGTIPFIGFRLKPKTAYGILLVLNFFGWAICFLMDYIVAAASRQFLCGPTAYLKERFWCGKLIVRFWRWIKKKSHQLYVYLTDLDITKPLQQNIIKVVVVNFILLVMLCLVMATDFLGIFGYWNGEAVAFWGVILVFLYNVWLYVMLRKYGAKVQRQYNSVLDATHEMAEGNLKIALKEEELGVMKPIGVELGRVQQGFSKAVAEEAKSQSMKTELITNVSHDLKTPLTAIITYVDLLKKDDISEEERKSYIATLDQKSQRLKVLIEDLFEVSKANSGNISMNFMEVDVVNLMKQVRLEMEDKIAASGLIFRWNLPEEKVILSLDGQRTYRVFENLLNNILKYSMPNSRVYIDILDKNLEVQVVFKNMSAAELDFDAERLTERFVRGDVSRKTEGSGLGLAIVKSFVELQNGKVDVSVDGDLFKVTLAWQKFANR